MLEPASELTVLRTLLEGRVQLSLLACPVAVMSTQLR